VIEKMNSGSRN